jgi:hypothetical protein
VAWIVVVVGALLVFAIAAAFVGSETFRLGHQTPAAIFDLEEAVEAVGDRLPFDSQARLTYPEVRQLVLASLTLLRSRGIGALPGEEVRPPAPGQEVVIGDDEAVAVVLGAVEAEGLDVADEDAFEVIRGLLWYLDHIGALGPQA